MSESETLSRPPWPRAGSGSGRGERGHLSGGILSVFEEEDQTEQWPLQVPTNSEVGNGNPLKNSQTLEFGNDNPVINSKIIYVCR